MYGYMTRHKTFPRFTISFLTNCTNSIPFSAILKFSLWNFLRNNLGYFMFIIDDSIFKLIVYFNTILSKVYSFSQSIFKKCIHIYVMMAICTHVLVVAVGQHSLHVHLYCVLVFMLHVLSGKVVHSDNVFFL